MSLEIWANSYFQEIEQSIFPGGEPHVRLKYPDHITESNVGVDARIVNANTFLSLLYLLEAIRAYRPKRLDLFIPYFPGGQQDRREPDQRGCCLTAAYNAKLINEFNCDTVTVVDPHSPVLTSHIKNARVSAQHGLSPQPKYLGVIQPDKGARTRAEFAANELSGFKCDVLPQTGTYLVVDDICVAGGTFIGLADKIKEQDPSISLDLYVTHGVFSKGLDALLGRFDKIYTTDSRPQTIENDRLIVTALTAGCL